MTCLIITTLIVLSSFTLGFIFGVKNPECGQKVGAFMEKVRGLIEFWRKK